MFLYEVSTLPNRAHPTPVTIAKGPGGPNLMTARAALEQALVRRLRPGRTPSAAEIAKSAQYAWTDYPEHRIMVRAYPQPETEQCMGRKSDGSRCGNRVSAIPDGAVVLCHAHR